MRFLDEVIQPSLDDLGMMMTMRRLSPRSFARWRLAASSPKPLAGSRPDLLSAQLRMASAATSQPQQDVVVKLRTALKESMKSKDKLRTGTIKVRGLHDRKESAAEQVSLDSRRSPTSKTLNICPRLRHLPKPCALRYHDASKLRPLRKPHRLLGTIWHRNTMQRRKCSKSFSPRGTT